MRHENNRVALLRHIKSNSCGSSGSGNVGNNTEAEDDATSFTNNSSTGTKSRLLARTGGGRGVASSACKSCGALVDVREEDNSECVNTTTTTTTTRRPTLKNFRSQSLQSCPEEIVPVASNTAAEHDVDGNKPKDNVEENNVVVQPENITLEMHHHGPRDLQKVITLWQNYYPEGQWGWIIVSCAIIVQCIAHGSQLAYSVLAVHIERKYHKHNPLQLGLLGSFSMLISLLLSPVWIGLCKRKSTRLFGIFGGLLAALGCLFSSFSTQFHQLFVSYGIFLGVGVGFSRDAAALMVGQYFKRKRNLVEIFVVAGSGAGIVTMSVSIHLGVHFLGWRLGMQAVTVCLLLIFFLGVLYRSASLYHPQRRAILHIKNQRRKVKEKYKRDAAPPFINWTCLKSKTLRILLVSSSVTCLGIHTPLLYMGWKCKAMKIDDMSMLLLHIYIGVAWVMSCLLFGALVIQNNDDCRLSKQYLCQGTGFFCGLSIIGLALVQELNGLTVFAWVYGFTVGAYEYTVKVYTLDRARARNFPWAWSLVQSTRGMSTFIGTCFAGLALSAGRVNVAFYLSSGVTICGTLLLFLADARKRKLRAKGKPTESFKATPHEALCGGKGLAFVLASDLNEGERIKADEGSEVQASHVSSMFGKKFSATSIAEDLAGIDLQDIYFEDWEAMLGGDAITSCNKVENCLASEADSSYTIGAGLERRSSVLYRGGRFSAFDGISGPAIRVAAGVIGIHTPDHRHHLCRIAETESFSSPSFSEDHEEVASGSSGGAAVPKFEFTEMSIPSFGSLKKKKEHSSPKGSGESST